MKLVMLESSRGDAIYINPDHVMGVGVVQGSEGALLVNNAGVLLVTGSLLTVVGSPHEVAARLVE